MKLRRFNDDGIARVRQVLPEIEKTGNLDVSALIADERLTIAIPELDSVDLDPDRTFPTTFAFCEYFHSLMKDHHPLNYRTDVGFWTWLAMVYLKQLVKIDDEGIVDVGDASRLCYVATVFGKSHRHLLASPYYLYNANVENVALVQVPLWHEMNTPGDILESIIARHGLVHNQAFLNAIRILYFDESEQKIRQKVAGPNQPGGIRRFADMVDQFGMTRDFCSVDDAREFIAVLPKEFDSFKPKVA